LVILQLIIPCPTFAAGGTSAVTGDKTASGGAATTSTGSSVTRDKVAAGGKDIKTTTKVKHKPIKYFVEGKRIRLDAEVQDKAGIELVRCYFKGKADADYVFVTMNQGEIQNHVAGIQRADESTCPDHKDWYCSWNVIWIK
jgi:hypothetical protein